MIYNAMWFWGTRSKTHTDTHAHTQVPAVLLYTRSFSGCKHKQWKAFRSVRALLLYYIHMYIYVYICVRNLYKV